MNSHKVQVYTAEGKPSGAELELPTVLRSVIRPDHVRYIHTQMAKNARQAYAVSPNSGYQTSAESWGTGRAVARIPRVSGGGTHRAGQAAFGNMCRGGGMYAPTKPHRRWHRKINVNERRHAVASCLAASSVAAMVMARGHKIEAVPEIPLVVKDEIEQMPKTKVAVDALKKLGCEAELVRCQKSRSIRAGKGKHRRATKYVIAKGPLMVYNSDREYMKAFRNIPGVECLHVSRLNLLKLAPGGAVGRFLIFSESAFKTLNDVYAQKSGYSLQRPLIANEDIGKIINSDEIQSVLRPQIVQRHIPKKTLNPWKNQTLHAKLNPAAVKKDGKK